MRIHVRRGLDLPLGGEPEQRVLRRVAPGSVAVLPADFRGLVPKPLVAVGDVVAAGQPLIADRRHPEIVCPSFVSGRVTAVERGPRRVLTRVVVSAEGDRELEFPAHSRRQAEKLAAGEVRDLLLASGLWSAIRTRPYERVPDPGVAPRALFVTAIDTHPLAPDPAVVLRERQEDFATGVRALSVLTGGDTWVCTRAGADFDVPEGSGIRQAEFAGPHPAGLPGTHLHASGLAVSREADLWHIGYQDVAAFGRLLTRGRLDRERIVSLAGPGVDGPGLLAVTPGTRRDALGPAVTAADARVLAGPPGDGRPAGEYLGRFDRQVTVLPARAELRGVRGLGRRALRRLAGVDAPAVRSGGMLPVDGFERVWPYRTPPAALLRALLIGDPDDAARLGCLGLAEDDVALLSLVCPAGIDYGAALRHTLDHIEAQG